MMLCRLVRLPHLLAAGLLVLTAFQAQAGSLAVPALTGRVVDQANILNAGEESRLVGKLSALEAKTSIQLVVVTLSSLQDRPIEEWGLTLGRSWGIGQKGEDNGVLLIIAPNDRELRIEVGYGLEGTLPDATADAIIRNVIVPKFKAGNLPGGISDGVDAIIAVLTGSGEAFQPSRREAVGQWLEEWTPLLFVGLFVVLVVMAQFRDHHRRRGTRYYRNRHGGWLYVDDNDRNWGGGRVGRGGGGFSGGGGSFGGGGASGRW